jgi:N-sulfoglucosamine sulfohydrolase
VLDGISFLKVLQGKTDKHRKYAYHVHNNVPEGPAYPIRSISDGKYRLIWNLTPEVSYFEKHIDRADWYLSWKKQNSKQSKLILDRFHTRPEFELYDIEDDIDEFKNLMGQPAYQKTFNRLHKELQKWMKSQGDLGIEMDKPKRN